MALITSWDAEFGWGSATYGRNKELGQGSFFGVISEIYAELKIKRNIDRAIRNAADQRPFYFGFDHLNVFGQELRRMQQQIKGDPLAQPQYIVPKKTEVPLLEKYESAIENRKESQSQDINMLLTKDGSRVRLYKWIKAVRSGDILASPVAKFWLQSWK